MDAFLVSLYNKKEREEVGALASKEDVRELLLSKLQLFTKLIVSRNGRSEEARVVGWCRMRAEANEARRVRGGGELLRAAAVQFWADLGSLAFAPATTAQWTGAEERGREEYPRAGGGPPRRAEVHHKGAGRPAAREALLIGVAGVAGGKQ